MMIDLIVVRIKENKEIVGIFEYIPNIIDLWWKIDEVVDPGLCEYADIDHVELPFEIFFSISKEKLNAEGDDEIKTCCELANISETMNMACDDLIREADFYDFMEIHPEIDYIAIDREANKEAF